MGKLTTEVDDPEAARAAAVAKQTDASQVVRDCEARVAAKTAERQAALDAAGAFARLMAAPGAEHDPEALKAHASEIAIAAAELAIEQETLDEARRLAAIAGVEVSRARLEVLRRETRRKYLHEAAAYKAHALAATAFVTTGKAVLAAVADRMAAADEVDSLAAELQGRNPADRIYRFPQELEVRRVMAALPVEWLREAGNGGFPVGDVDFHEQAERTAARAAV